MHLIDLLWPAKQFDDFQVWILLPNLKFGRDKVFFVVFECKRNFVSLHVACIVSFRGEEN